jgi:hypothetical protein
MLGGHAVRTSEELGVKDKEQAQPLVEEFPIFVFSE